MASCTAAEKRQAVVDFYLSEADAVPKLSESKRCWVSDTPSHSFIDIAVSDEPETQVQTFFSIGPIDTMPA